MPTPIAEKTNKLSIRQRLRTIQNAMLECNGQVDPAFARGMLLQLTALAGSVADERRKADQEYALVLLRQHQESGKMAGARLIAETTPAFWRAREAADWEHQIDRLCMNLRHAMDSLR